MSVELNRSQIAVTRKMDREFTRLTDLYFHSPIKDDGLRDALSYATALLNYYREWGDEELYDRWFRAFDLATRPEEPSLDELRIEVFKDGQELLNASENIPQLKKYGIALQNLADSI